MYTITLKTGEAVLVDKDVFDKYGHLKWHISVGYARHVRKGQKAVYLHWVVMGGKHVDHINGNRLDNRRANLRFATQQQQCQNRSKTNKPTSSQYIGVYKYLNKWRARVAKIDLGSYKTEQEAAFIRDQVAMQTYGKFAKFNLLEDK